MRDAVLQLYELGGQNGWVDKGLTREACYAAYEASSRDLSAAFMQLLNYSELGPEGFQQLDVKGKKTLAKNAVSLAGMQYQ